MKTWKYYNHALTPTTTPHEEVDIQPVNKNQTIKRKNQRREKAT